MDHGILLLDFITKPLSHFMEHVLEPLHSIMPAWFFVESNHMNHVVYMWLYMLLLIIIATLAAKSVKLIPSRLQNFLEVIVGGLRGLVINTMGEEGLRFFPLMATLALFILIANLGGIFPGFYSPTANLNTNAAMALVVFFMTHIVGVRIHGAKYLKQFVGPVWWLAPLMLPIELIGPDSAETNPRLRR